MGQTDQATIAAAIRTAVSAKQLDKIHGQQTYSNYKILRQQVAKIAASIASTGHDGFDCDSMWPGAKRLQENIDIVGACYNGCLEAHRITHERQWVMTCNIVANATYVRHDMACMLHKSCQYNI